MLTFFLVYLVGIIPFGLYRQWAWPNLPVGPLLFGLLWPGSLAFLAIYVAGLFIVALWACADQWFVSAECSLRTWWRKHLGPGRE